MTSASLPRGIDRTWPFPRAQTTAYGAEWTSTKRPSYFRKAPLADLSATVSGRPHSTLSRHTQQARAMRPMPLLRHSLRRAGRGILAFGSARSVWSNTPSRPLGSDRNDVAANCRDVEGNHRLGQAPQGERAELLGFDA